jgi:hypothetical protein
MLGTPLIQILLHLIECGDTNLSGRELVVLEVYIVHWEFGEHMIQEVLILLLKSNSKLVEVECQWFHLSLSRIVIYIE